MLVLALAALAGVILGEYQQTWIVGALSGVGTALLLTEALLGLGRWRGLVATAWVGAASAGAVLWAGVINTNHGRVDFPPGALLGAALAVVVSVLRVRPTR